MLSDTAITSLIGGLVSVLTAYLAFKANENARKAKEEATRTHDVVNSRMDEFKKIYAALSKAEGKQEERIEEQQRKENK